MGRWGNDDTSTLEWLGIVDYCLIALRAREAGGAVRRLRSVG
jgi:hypothetical protein